MNRKLWVVCPIFFDVPSFKRVRAEVLEQVESNSSFTDINFVAIDDSAHQDPEMLALHEINDITIITPPYNLGHQGAIVYSLRKLRDKVKETDFIVTMDSDGEDRPQDLFKLLKPQLANEDNLHLICLAWRTKRREKLPFKILYTGYKFLFRSLTGLTLRNGNFATYRGWILKNLIDHPHFDQSYSSTFLSLPLQKIQVPLPRGERYQGQSKLGYFGLVIHGARMLLPFTERISIRVAMFSVATILINVIASTSVVLQRPNISPEIYSAFLTASILIYLSSFVSLVGSVLSFAIFTQTKSRNLRDLNVVQKQSNYIIKPISPAQEEEFLDESVDGRNERPERRS